MGNGFSGKYYPRLSGSSTDKVKLCIVVFIIYKVIFFIIMIK